MIPLEEGPDGKLRPVPGAQPQEHVGVNPLARLLGIDRSTLERRLVINTKIRVRRRKLPGHRKGIYAIRARGARELILELLHPKRDPMGRERETFPHIRARRKAVDGITPFRGTDRRFWGFLPARKRK